MSRLRLAGPARAETERSPIRVDAEHEVYLTDPAVLTGVVNDMSMNASVRSR